MSEKGKKSILDEALEAGAEKQSRETGVSKIDILKKTREDIIQQHHESVTPIISSADVAQAAEEDIKAVNKIINKKSK